MSIATDAAVTAKGRQTRGRIVQAAAELILSKGVTATTIDEICAAADVGKSQIYHYFADKSAVVRGVIELQTERVLGCHEPVFERMNSWDDWQAWRDWIVSAQSSVGFRWGCPLGSLANELADSDDLARRMIDSSFERWERGFRLALGRMVDANVLKPEADLVGLSTFLLSSLQGGLLLSEARKDAAPLRRALDSALAYVRTFAV